MKRLVIDDRRFFIFPPEDTTYARTIETGERLLKESSWDEVWLDHDMGLLSKDVSVLVDKLEREAYGGSTVDVGLFVIHTANPAGRDRMKIALAKNYKVKVVDPWDVVDYDKEYLPKFVNGVLVE